ncbi:MAG TPA: YihY/virulence factor BrkB family protein [Thermoanaerobaculia bacterium]|nr:YihY/virulence factor BrkB family protein [Thermoanaerobaculia bacterium]
MKRYVELFKKTWKEFSDDKAQRLGASLAYYTLFSIAPLLLVCIAIAGLVFGKSQAQAQIVSQIKSVMGDAGGKAITDMLQNAAKPKTGTLAIIIGTITLLLGAAGVFGNLKDALNTIWEVPEKKGGGIMAMLKQRFLSFAMVLGVGFLLLVSLVIDAALSAVSSALWQPLQLIVSFIVVTLLFAMIFRYLPDIHPAWHDVWFGAGFTSLLFIIGKFALGLYLGKSAVGSAYGAAGSLVALLVWIYWSSNILFFGAEFTQVYARAHGSMKGVAAGFSQPNGELKDAAPQPKAQPKAANSGGGLKLVLGGIGGLFIGIFAGVIAGMVVAVKSVKKLLSAAIH